MSKKQGNAIAVREAASLAARAVARLEKEAHATLADETAKRLQLVSAKDTVRGFFQSGKVTIQIEDGDFAISIAD